ncbi:MAG: glycosyltransferase [Deltaproteobacteria bacterium]|nr:glycosyltransferase [Deltaproteobacteria bacterium]MBW2135238.1 glycosyltransferase [Deltaproteobacteria bacterium]
MWLIINKRPWLTNRAMVNISLQSAYGLAEAGERVEFVVAGQTQDWRADMRQHYGLEPHPRLTVRVIDRFCLGRVSSSLPIFLYPFIRSRSRRFAREPMNILSRDSGMLPYMVFLKFWGRARIFLEVHHAYANLPRLRAAGLRLSLEEKKNYLLERLFCKYLDMLVCITAPQAQLYQEVFSNLPKTVLPLGTRPRPSLSAAEKFKKRTLVYIGTFSMGKGIKTLLQALTGVDPGITLLIIGGSSRTANATVSQEIDSLGLTGRVRFMGSLPPAELYRICATQASVGVLPLKDTFYTRNLTSPAKLGDYQSFGLPVLASRLPTTELLLSEGEDAFFFQPDDVQSLTQAIKRIFADEERFVQMVRAAEAHGRERSWTWRAEQLINLSQSLSLARQGDTVHLLKRYD